MKKKSLLLSVLAVCFMGMQAADVKTVWAKELPLPRELNDAAGNDLVAVSATNEVYVTGMFKGELEFAGEFLDTEGLKSTYLLKYNADGSEAWAVAFSGAVTPTAITVAEDGSVYIAGTLADEVTMGSTDGKTQKIDGIEDEVLDMDGNGTGVMAYIKEQAAAFVAQYSADGVLQKANSYKPQKFSDESILLQEYVTDVFMSINHLQVANTKLYAGLTVGGQCGNDAVDISGTVFLYEFFGMNMLNPVGYVVSLDDKLDFDAVVTKLALNAETQNPTTVSNSFTIDGDNMYVAYTSKGKQVLTVGKQTKDITFTMMQEDFKYATGYLVLDINLADKTLQGNAIFEHIPTGAYDDPTSAVHSLDVAGDRLVLTGIFENELPFNNEITSVGATNAFTAVLKKADLTVATAQSSNYTGDEVWASSAVWGDSVYVAANDTVNKEGHKHLLDLQQPKVELPSGMYQNRYVNALATQGKRMAQVEVVLGQDETTALRISMLSTDPNESSVGEVIDHELTFYPNPVKNSLYLNKASDVQIYNLSGVVVAQAVNARQINLEALAPGSYIVSAKNSDGVQRLPFIKE